MCCQDRKDGKIGLYVKGHTGAQKSNKNQATYLSSVGNNSHTLDKLVHHIGLRETSRDHIDEREGRVRESRGKRGGEERGEVGGERGERAEDRGRESRGEMEREERRQG